MSETATVQYRPLPPDLPPDELERELLARWAAEGLFRRTVEARAGGDPFVFFEGPPTANGRPGIHHVFARTLKDLFCRYRSMKGFHVTRKAGWDTHGLPVEIEVEKEILRELEAQGIPEAELKRISGKQLIERVGVAEFNRRCRESVWRYKDEWQKLSERIAYWLDYDDAYITYANAYVESVWWALATLYRRELLYRGHKILPYCPRCGTALSSHELALGYQTREDPSVYVALDVEATDAGPVARVAPGSSGAAGGASSAPSLAHERSARRILVWTTTPWTLVSNTALAVNPELTYVELRRRASPDVRTVILADERVADVLGGDWSARWDVVERLPGRSLVGWRYRRPFDWLAYPAGAHEIILGESFVSAEDGTGVVHLAPAFGADDFAAGARHGLAFLQPVDARGMFPPDLPVAGGMGAKEADPHLVEELKRRGLLWKSAMVPHEYPHCWRCGTPLLYYARGSWFVRTTGFRDRMLARNAQVDWHPPEMGAGRFGQWLENNIDWAISRDRYWGTPLPVWQCDASEEHVDVLGGFDELSERIGRTLPADFDPHKPYIDEYTWPCREPGCGGTLRRVPEVIDTWFDSGSMPFAQWHFPFEGRERVQREYPADFIAEGVDQTRGWFYSLLAIATGLGDALPNNDGRAGAEPAAPYRSVVVNDLVLDADGVKMSKSRGNVVNPWAVIERHGADAVRLFLIATSQVWVPRRFDEQGIRETVGRFLLTLKNVYSGFFAEYANFGWAPSADDPPPEQRPPVDRWMLSRLAGLEATVDGLMERYEATAAARAIMDFVVDDVSQWYVRLNRDRFYDVHGADNRAAFATLHDVLVVTCRLLAPLAPFVTDWMHRELTGESVHLASYVRTPANRSVVDHELEAAMSSIRTVARLARAAREEAGIKVRQPLSRLVCVVPEAPETAVTPLIPLLAAELNVKQVEIASSADALVTLQAKPNFRSLGKKWGKATPEAAAAVSALGADALRAIERGESVTIEVGGERRAVEPEDLTIVRRASGSLVVKEEGAAFAAIDPTITEALRGEGLARELVSRIQRVRKESGFAVSDRIALGVAGGEDVEEPVRAHQEWIASEVLARTVAIGDAGLDGYQVVQDVDLDGIPARIAITRVG